MDLNSSENECEDPTLNLKVNDFIKVECLYNEGSKKETYKQFVCQIKNITKGIRGLSFICSFMRGHKNSKEKFVFHRRYI